MPEQPKSHANGERYFVESVPDPVAVVLFKDKVVIVRASGHIIERELADQKELLPPFDQPADDDFQKGDSA